MPRICAGCRAAIAPAAAHDREVAGVLCAPCLRAVRPLERDTCPRCQQPARRARKLALCGRCAQERSALDGCVAAVAFEADAEKWIHAFKYPEPGLAGLVPGPEAVVRALVRDALTIHRAPSPQAVIPVPLHPQRLRARGFNPAAVLAREVARATGSRFDPDTLARVRDTPSQTRLDRRTRRANVRGAFACTRAPARDVWLVDDVVTTGSTLEEAARNLRKAGAKCVRAVCAARTP